MDTQTITQELPKQPPRFWSMMQIGLASALIIPLGGCYLLGRNYEALNEPKNAKLSYILGILGFLLLLTIVFFLPQELMDQIPHFMWSVCSLALIGGIARQSQQEIIKEKIEAGCKRYSYWWWLALMVSIGVIQFLLSMLFLMLAAFAS